MVNRTGHDSLILHWQRHTHLFVVVIIPEYHALIFENSDPANAGSFIHVSTQHHQVAGSD